MPPAGPFTCGHGKSMLWSRVFVMNLCNFWYQSKGAIMYQNRPCIRSMYCLYTGPVLAHYGVLGIPPFQARYGMSPHGLWLEGVAFWGVDLCCKINHWQGIITTVIVQYGHCSHFASGSMILQAHVTTSFWRDNDVVVVSCVRWGVVRYRCSLCSRRSAPITATHST